MEAFTSEFVFKIAFGYFFFYGPNFMVIFICLATILSLYTPCLFTE